MQTRSTNGRNAHVGLKVGVAKSNRAVIVLETCIASMGQCCLRRPHLTCFRLLADHQSRLFLKFRRHGPENSPRSLVDGLTGKTATMICMVPKLSGFVVHRQKLT